MFLPFLSYTFPIWLLRKPFFILLSTKLPILWGQESFADTILHLEWSASSGFIYALPMNSISIFCSHLHNSINHTLPVCLDFIRHSTCSLAYIVQQISPYICIIFQTLQMSWFMSYYLNFAMKTASEDCEGQAMYNYLVASITKLNILLPFVVHSHWMLSFVRYRCSHTNQICKHYHL